MGNKANRKRPTRLAARKARLENLVKARRVLHEKRLDVKHSVFDTEYWKKVAKKGI